MDDVFARLRLADVWHDVFRNIVSLRESQNLFDDLSSRIADWQLAQRVEDEVKPTPYRSRVPVIDRPFEDAEWFNAIQWPFTHWQHSRFSDGSFGVWYGSEAIETTVHETAFHWVAGLLADAGFEHETVTIERKVYRVACHAALLDFRPLLRSHSELLHKTDYAACQAIGARLHREGHPGLVTGSARHEGGVNYAVLNPRVLADPRASCYLTYRLQGPFIRVERQPGRTWLKLPHPARAS